MILVYVSGPYSSDPQHNTELAVALGAELMRLGYAPIVPHLSHFADKLHPQDWDAWMAIDFEYVRRSDCVIRLPGQSTGADLEVQLATSLGLPIFYSLEELQNYYG